MADLRIGASFAALDDVTVRIIPAHWHAWDMAALDEAIFGGALKTPGYLLPVD